MKRSVRGTKNDLNMMASADLTTDIGAPLTASADFTLGTDVLALLDREPRDRVSENPRAHLRASRTLPVSQDVLATAGA